MYLDHGICNEGDIRLVDGFIENEGRLEVCYNGVWGAVCDHGWDSTDAHVVCTQLGYPKLGENKNDNYILKHEEVRVKTNVEMITKMATASVIKY